MEVNLKSKIAIDFFIESLSGTNDSNLELNVLKASLITKVFFDVNDDESVSDCCDFGIDFNRRLFCIDKELKYLKLLKTILNESVGLDEAVIMNNLIEMLTPEALGEVLKGAHYRLIDDGFYYREWSQLKAARERISSHPSLPGSKQYGVAGPLSHEILFGIVEDKGRTCTFFQFENTPWGEGFKNRFYHTIDAMHYLSTLKTRNIGPYGKSIYTDKFPVYMTIRNK